MYCDKVKEYLSQKGVKFTERNLSTDPAAVHDLRKMNVLTLPLTVIDGHAVTGFKREKIDELLEKPG